ncbi:MAG TPA: S49 family peptidase [Chlamydiales bacterium]|nr:S49 family peptidase [Chlamydiales bacterium]
MEFQKESIFVAGIRSLFKSFLGTLGFFIALFIGIIGSMLLTSDTDIRSKKTKMTILPDLKGKTKLVSQTAPVILEIKIHGPIGTNDLNYHTIADEIMDAQKFLSTKRIKGIMLHLNTPGGTVIDSDTIYCLIKAFKEKTNIPVYGYINGVCASGGMYIASSTDKIYASSVSIIGSVGVLYGPYFNVSKFLEKYDIESRTITQGKDKDLLSPFRKWKENEDQSLINITKYYYDKFVDIVVAARPALSKEKLIEEYGAHVFPAPQAMQYGYIDEISPSYQDALKELLIAANIDTDKPYQIVEMKPMRKIFTNFIESCSHLSKGKIKHSFELNDTKKDLDFPFLYLFDPKQ